MTTVLDWHLWAPPLDPPVSGGLPADQAEAIALATWDTDPHLCAALQWEVYAGMQPPGAAVSQVATGVQSVTYQPPMPGGEAGAAMARAAWHRSLMSGLATVGMDVAAPALPTVPGTPWLGYPGGDWGNWWDVAPPVDGGSGGPPPLGPTPAFFWAPGSPKGNANVTFDASGSVPGDAPIVAYDWTFDTYSHMPDAGPVVVWRTPSGTGGKSYAITLGIRDDNGLTAVLGQTLVTS